ncbi:sugar kinase [Archaeoglobales archaeon]|nr:MAG: sugar kinase [Archaeoglobales archaeon]
MDVIGFGALNLDKIYRVDKIPREDEEGFVKDVELHPGGSAANTIVGLARLGLKTGYIGKVGNDGEGELLLKDFERENVDVNGVVKAEGRSGNALIFVDDQGHRAILVDPGVNDTIRFDEVNLDYVSKFKLIHLTSFICKNGLNSFLSQKRLVECLDIKVSFDPGMIYVERGLDDLKDILKRTTLFMPNRMEIEMLFNEEYTKAARMAIELGVEIVVVKLGKKGCYIYDGKNEISVRAEEVNAVDTTGAGDAFNAGFIFGYLSGKDLKDCGRLGNLIAGLNIQKVGARAGLPRYEELNFES